MKETRDSIADVWGQQAWLVTQIQHRAPHTLVVPQ